MCTTMETYFSSVMQVRPKSLTTFSLTCRRFWNICKPTRSRTRPMFGLDFGTGRSGILQSTIRPSGEQGNARGEINSNRSSHWSPGEWEYASDARKYSTSQAAHRQDFALCDGGPTNLAGIWGPGYWAMLYLPMENLSVQVMEDGGQNN